MSKPTKLALAALSAISTLGYAKTIDVRSHGAKPNDSADDKAAIEAALAASAHGDVIIFAGGAYNFSDQFSVPGGRTLRTDDGSALVGRGKGNQAQLIKALGDNTNFFNLTLRGGGIFFAKNGGRNTNVTVDNCVFDLNTSGEQNAGITMTAGLNNFRITNNRFTGYNVSFGIYGYNYKDGVIANNEFVNVRAGMHIDAFGDSGNLLVEQNYMTGLKGMGMEFQGTAANLKFYDNFYEKPNLSTVRKDNDTSFAFSLILDKSQNIEIKRNTVIAPERPDGIGCRVAFEVGGDNCVLEENLVDGVNHVIAANDGVGGSSILVKNNRWSNILQGPGGLRPNSMTFAGVNGPTAPLAWDINRGIPKRNQRFGSAPNPVPVPEPDPTPDPVPAPTTRPADVPADGPFVWVSDMTDLTVQSNGWGPVERNLSNGENGAGDGKTITLNGATYQKGIGVHATAQLSIPLSKRYSRFRADVGIDDEVGTKGKAVFEVVADDQIVWSSGEMTGASDTRTLAVDVTGVNVLQLRCVSDVKDYAHGDWAHARLYEATANGELDALKAKIATLTEKLERLKTEIVAALDKAQ